MKLTPSTAFTGLSKYFGSGAAPVKAVDGVSFTIARGETPAERLLRLYETEWQGDVTRVYEESF